MSLYAIVYYVMLYYSTSRYYGGSELPNANTSKTNGSQYVLEFKFVS